MPKIPLVEFTIRLSDLQKATKKLSINRRSFKETDSADLLVSECAVTFRAIGTSTEEPVRGISPGTVRLPLRILAKVVGVAKSYNKIELSFRFEQGVVRVEKFSLNHPDITLGILPNPKFELPIDADPMQTLTMASLLSLEQILDQGLRERVETAQRYVSAKTSTAAGILQELGIQPKEVTSLVDQHIRKIANLLQPSIQP
jgi:hypothetical protein